LSFLKTCSLNDSRSYNNEVRESINAMFRIAEELKKVVLVGGWSVYYWVDNVLVTMAFPQLTLTFLQELKALMK